MIETAQKRDESGARHAGDADIIFVSMETWDDVWRRNQFICAELARRQPFRRILFVGPAVDMSAAARRGRADEMRGRGTRAVSELPNITVTRPVKWLPNRLGFARHANEAALRRHVRREAGRLGFYAKGKRPLLWLNPYYAEHMSGRMSESATIYDITDDWTHFGRDRRQQQRVTAQDRALCDKADAIIVCSEALLASKHAYADRVSLIKNGVDCRHYATVMEAEATHPECTQSWERPVLGYTGTIHRDRLNVAMVYQMASRMDRGSVVLIGPNHLNARERQMLESTGRVAIAGVVPYQQLPHYMRAFDVCIVPHCVTPFTESLNPIKLWEYLASGKPIVSTPVAGFRDYPEHVRIAADAEAFLAAAYGAVSENGTCAAERRRLAADHSWATRVDQVEAVMQAALESREVGRQ